MTLPHFLISIVPPQPVEGFVRLEYPLEMAIWAMVGLGGLLTGFITVLVVEHRLTVARREATGQATQASSAHAGGAPGRTASPVTVHA